MNAIKELKAEIFDIIVEQDRAQVYHNDMEKIKQEKITKLSELIKAQSEAEAQANLPASE